MKWLLLMLTLFSAQASAADWQFLGASSVGQHFVDPASLKWEADRAAFSIATRVLEKDGGEWLTTLRIACQANNFAYLHGKHIKKGKTLASFSTPRPAESISAGSMPDQLHKEYCRLADRKEIQWQEIGKSSIATVYYDPASVRQNQERTRFKADTRVQPFAGDEQTFTSMSFDCADDTFTVLRMSKVKNGQAEQIFDRPQRATPTSKTATLARLADKFCGQPASRQSGSTQSGSTSSAPAKTIDKSSKNANQAACNEELAKLKAMEAQVQYDFDNSELQCERAEKYVKELVRIDSSVKKLQCAVADLQGYIQTVQAAGCANE